SDFDRRFIAVCTSQGLARARCDCLLGVFKEHIADDNLELIIGYFEDPAGFQDRIAELDLDPERAEALREEIDEAVAASREECGTGP
ncbi:MAG TPA: hypothetical protein PK264_21430, partial [Hyphomicrobiaceae bacterium]|nr:hypothetical protein [Hyphomicrobiaceae bacterium]